MTVKLYDLKNEHLKNLLQKEELNKKEVIDLLVHYHEQHPTKINFTRKEIEQLFLSPWNVEKLNYVMEKARVFFKRQYNIEPTVHTDNTDPNNVVDGYLIYSKRWKLHVAEQGEFKPLNYFD